MIRLSVSIRKAAFCSLKLLLATKYTVTKKSALFPVKNADFFIFVKIVTAGHCFCSLLFSQTHETYKNVLIFLPSHIVHF